jgi:beta-galactosidase
VEIIVTDREAINPNNMGADGVTITTTEVSEQVAKGTLKVELLTDNLRGAEALVEIVAPNGRVVERKSGKARNEEGKMVVTIPFEVSRPTLWQAAENPALYEFRVRSLQGGEPCDSITVRSGFRNFTYTANGLSLNDKPFIARGVIMHRDRSLVGTAVSADNVTDDLDIISEMGANTIYVVGGSMGREFYDECDRRGLVVITGIPFTGSNILNQKGYFNTESFRKNGRQQLDETICQLAHHPSIMAWNLFTEMEIRGESPIDYLRELNSRAKSLDPTRMTAGLSNQDGDINFITDLIVWSHTFGWIEGQPEDITIWQRQMHSHSEWSTLRSAVAYRCGGNVLDISEVLEKPIASGSLHPERWQTHFHDVYMNSLAADSLFWGSFINCMFDFGSVNSIGGDGTGINDSGIVTFDRLTRKDAYYIYKAAWNETVPFIHIAEKRWKRRRESTQNIIVYSNQPSVKLIVNGVALDSVEPVNGKHLWEGVSLMPGRNTIEAKSGNLAEKATIEILTNNIIL